MTYNTPRVSIVASVETKVQGNSNVKDSSVCRDHPSDGTSSGAYEVDE
jgi:hypothetical protein